jgi:toxin YoeB
MELEFTITADRDLKYWKKINDEAFLKRIRALLESILENPYSGIGNPEKLKHELTGKMSRKINK